MRGGSAPARFAGGGFLLFGGGRGWLPFLAAGSAGVGGASWGACPAGRRLTLPFRNLLGWLAFFLARLPCL